MDFKTEIEIKDEPFEYINDDALNTHCSDQVLQSDKIIQRLIGNDNDGEKDVKEERTLRSRPTPGQGINS